MNQQQLAQSVQQLLHQNAQINKNMAEMNQTLVQISQRLQNMEDLLPLRLYNASIDENCPLQYPPAVTVAPPIPKTKIKLRDLTVAQCNAVAGTLGLAQLGPGVTTEMRKDGGKE